MPFSVPYTVELGLGGSLIARALTTSEHYKFWRMTVTNSNLSVSQEMSIGAAPTGWSSGDTLTLVGSPLVNQPSALPEGGMAIRLNGSSQYLRSVYDETSAPGDIGPQTLECVVTIHAVPGGGEEAVVMGGSTDFAVTAMDDGNLYGYYNGAAVVDLSYAIDEPLHILLVRADTSPDTITLYVNGVSTSVSATNGNITRGYVHLGKHWTNAHYLNATYSFAAFYPVAFDAIDAAAHYAAVAWTDVAAEGDVGNGPILIERGIRDASPLARVAASGLCRFTLNNSFTNSAETTGYYSPGHADVRDGFGIGIPVRVSIMGEGQFLGRIASLRPVPGRRFLSTTEVIAADILNDAARFRLNQIPLLEDVRSDEVFLQLVARFPNQPAGLIAYEGSEVYPVALDNSQDESVNALEEFVRLAQSEFGRIFVTRTGILVHENRDTRAAQSVALELDEFEIEALEVDEDSRDKLNRVETKVHPRQPGDDPNTVLYALVNPLQLAAGESKPLVGPYRVENAPSGVEGVGGREMQQPVAGTDYAMFANSDGTGTDLTANLSVVVNFGANGVNYTLRNTGGTTGFVTLLQFRGLPLFDFRPTVSVSEDSALIADHGVNSLAIDMPYQIDPTVGEIVAARVLAAARAQRVRAKSVTLRAFDGESDLPDDLLALDVSDRIALSESVSGLDGDYFIDGIQVTLEPGAWPQVKWWLRPPEQEMT